MSAVAPPTYVRDQLEGALALLACCGAEDALVRAEMLYAHWYAKLRSGFEVPFGCPPDLTEMLRTAHASSRDWEEGWRVDAVSPRGQAVVRRGAELRLLDRIDYSPIRGRGLLPLAGDQVLVTGRRDHVEPKDGWWRTSGGDGGG